MSRETKPKAEAKQPEKSVAKPRASKAVAKPELRDPTEAERAAGAAALAAQAKRPARPSLTIASKGGGPGAGQTISNPHSDWQGWNAQIGDAFGSTSDDYAHQAFARLGAIVREGNEMISEGRANSMLALMAAIGPQNELEAAIGEQIVASHVASMEFLSRAKINAGQYRDTAVAYVNAATKLSRTMAAQVETLAKLRGGGRQRIEVVYVNGPAAFGDGAQIAYAPGAGGRGYGEAATQSHATAQLSLAAAAPGLPLRCTDPQGNPVHVTSGEEPEALSDARRDEPGRT